MAELTWLEARVLDRVRVRAAAGEPVPCWRVLQDLARWASSTTIRRALASLVSKGLLSKPRRGHYLPTEENA